MDEALALEAGCGVRAGVERGGQCVALGDVK